MLCGRLPSSSERLADVCRSSDCNFNSLNSSRKERSSARKVLMRSSAFSFLEGLSSCLARSE